MAGEGRIVGFHVKKHDALAVIMDDVGWPVRDELDRLALPSGMDDAAALDTLMRDAAQHFRRLRPKVVALCDTTKTNRWILSDLRPRVRIETVLQLAAVAIGCDAYLVSPHDAARTFAASGYELSDAVLQHVDLSGYTYPSRRALAVGAAWHAARVGPEEVLPR